MLVTISGLIGRAPQSLPATAEGLPVVEAALGVVNSDGKDWYAIQFTGEALQYAQQIRKGDTLAVTGELTFAPSSNGFKPVVAVSDLQLCDLPVAY
jgi:hypothetical protein